MKVLGLNGSARQEGNSELLLKKALSEAANKGAMTEQVNLTELDIQPCKGCMRCVFKDKPCYQQDDMDQLLEKIKAADGLILAAPIYFLAPAGILKMVIDRSLVIMKEVSKAGSLKKDRVAATIGVAGLEEWETFGRELLNIFPLAFQFELLGTFFAYAPGPGETLLDDENIENAKKTGAAVVNREKVFESQDNTSCPVCTSRLFAFNDKEGGVICPVCGVKGVMTSINPVTIDFDTNSIKSHRWVRENIEKHYRDWILESKNRFKKVFKHIEDVKQKQFKI